MRTRILPPLLAAIGGALLVGSGRLWRWGDCLRCELRRRPCRFHDGFTCGWDAFANALDHLDPVADT